MDLSRQNSFLKTKYGEVKEFSNKKIIIIGAGGVGSPILELLVRGGFNNLIIIDFDVVDNSNLQRQIYIQEDISKFKVNALKQRLIAINPQVNVEINVDQITKENISKYCRDSDLIIDATDNFECRFIINEFAKQNDKPWIYSGAIRGEIICALFQGKKSNFDKIISKDAKNEDCSVGVLASTTFIAASIVFNEVIKYFQETKYSSKLIKFNIWQGKYFEVKI